MQGGIQCHTERESLYNNYYAIGSGKAAHLLSISHTEIMTKHNLWYTLWCSLIYYNYSILFPSNAHQGIIIIAPDNVF